MAKRSATKKYLEGAPLKAGLYASADGKVAMVSLVAKGRHDWWVNWHRILPTFSLAYRSDLASAFMTAYPYPVTGVVLE